MLIVIKEHPDQFIYPAMGEQAQWPEYYDSFKALPKVKFFAQTTPSLALKDVSIAVATVSGTVGWEAIVRCKPLLCFGHGMVYAL
jgi:capsule polysaccharide export protein KpsC/LpsZ